LFYYAKTNNSSRTGFQHSNGHGERGSLLRDGKHADDDDLTDCDDNAENESWKDGDDDDDDPDIDDHEDAAENEKRELSSLLSNGKKSINVNDTNSAVMKKKKRTRRRRTMSSHSNRSRTMNSLVTIESASTQSLNNNPMQEMSSKILNDIQGSLEKTKLEWMKKLEEYQFRSLGGVGRGISGGSGGSLQGVGVVAGTTGTQDSSSAMVIIQKVPPTPFRVVLELFAGEDVVSNGRLETVYDADDGTALMFFIPQLLSFLLHGALESSSQLEDWILDKCRKNVFFAHKCYWFLRAWALESTNLTCGDGQQKSAMRLRKSSSLASFEAAEDMYDGSTTSMVAPKLLPEEYAVIEDLMRKVMEYGEEPARLVHFGPMINSKISNSNTSERELSSSDDDRVISSPSALMTVVESGRIPIDPHSGMPSAKHFECLAASRRYGFLPMQNSLTTNLAPLIQGNQDRSYFDATPVFLDALLTIADGLFKVPRELRSAEFRKQLNLLEVEALPSNDIYIPLQDPHHRVWRIVSDESIAISTKVRYIDGIQPCQYH
jgi:hypothetical protein